MPWSFLVVFQYKKNPEEVYRFIGNFMFMNIVTRISRLFHINTLFCPNTDFLTLQKQCQLDSTDEQRTFELRCGPPWSQIAPLFMQDILEKIDFGKILKSGSPAKVRLKCQTLLTFCTTEGRKKEKYIFNMNLAFFNLTFKEE